MATPPVPVAMAVPSVPAKPPGLTPAPGILSRAATTQPMSLPRTPAISKPARPASPPIPARTVNSSTQRLVLAGATGRVAASKPAAVPVPGGTINLPIGMILRSLPPEVLAGDVAAFEASGAAATEVALPLPSILGQLPSGKVELPLQELIAQFPTGFLQPAEVLAPYLATPVALPLMDVVMRIPPNLLTVRPDQKDVDAAATQMSDPFTEETLREQAVAARPKDEANIVDESQVAPAEEFVPQAATPPRRTSFVPPPRTGTLPRPGVSSSASFPVEPDHVTAPTEPLPMPVAPAPAWSPEKGFTPAPTRPLLSSSQSLSAASSPVSASQAPSFKPAPAGVKTSPTSSLSPVAPIDSSESGLVVSRPTPPPFRPPTQPIPMVSASTPAPPPAAIEEDPSNSAPTILLPRPVSGSLPSVAPTAPAPEPPVDDLQRLAALAMQEIGDEPATDNEPITSEEPMAEAPVVEEPIRAEPVDEALAAAPEPLPDVPDSGPKPAFKAEPMPEATPLKPEAAVAAAPRGPVSDDLRRLAETAPVAAAAAPAEVGQPDTGRRSITTRVPTETSPLAMETAPVPTARPTEAPAVAINLNSCTAEDLLPIPGLSRDLAAAIIAHRAKIGEFQKLEDLLDVPGITRSAYRNLTGEAAPSGMHESVNELLGFPPEQNVTLKDVTDRIACWPDVTGCLLSQRNGLLLVGSVPSFLDQTAIVAFAPRMFDEINKSFAEITRKQTDELIVPTTGTSFHMLRAKDLYLTILARVPQMPERHMKIARFVLAGLSVRQS